MNPQLLSLSEIIEEAAVVATSERLNLRVDLKPDGSLVTNADTAVETFLRRELLAILPGSTFWGEEFGHEPEGEEGLWLIDPIDGTSNFSFGGPLWGISIGLLRKGRLVLGGIGLPDLREIYVAGFEQGAWLNGDQMPIIPAGPILPHQLISVNGSDKSSEFVKGVPGKRRDTGAAVIDGAFFCTQRHRAHFGKGERLYDVAASLLIGMELGAEIRYQDGTELDVNELASPQHLKPWAMIPAESGLF